MQRNHEPVTFNEWLMLYLYMMLPIFNLIKLITMAGDKEINPVLSNWAKAMLWMMLIGVGVGIVYALVVSSLLKGALYAM